MEVCNQFIEAVNGMRKNQYASDVYINYPLDSQTDDTIIFHDEALLPHWREVAVALEINSEKLKSEKTEEDAKSRAYDALFGAMTLSPDIMEDPSQLDRLYNDLYSDGDGEMGLRCQFVADKVELRKEVLDIIGPPLLLCPFDSIRLENNRFDREGILFAIDLLKHNKSMVSLHLAGNTIETDDDFNLLSEVISNHPSLKELDLTRCAGPNITSVSVNSIVLASKGLKTLHLTGNDISTDGSSIIADCLAADPPLQELFLAGNKLNDDDAELIAEGLKTNTNLKKIDLRDNAIGRLGCKALFKAIFNDESLNSVSSSNHTCDILASSYKIPCINKEIFGGKSGVLLAKKFAMIAPPNDQDVNVHLFSEVPPELIHKVLKLVQKYPEKNVWKYMRHLLQGDELLESGAAHVEESSEEEELFGKVISMDEIKRQQAEAVKLVQIKYLSVLMGVVKGVVVPMFF
eukprot:scaffold33574_cov152-Skeletonema_marinoi.AAC.1